MNLIWTQIHENANTIDLYILSAVLSRELDQRLNIWRHTIDIYRLNKNTNSRLFD